MNNWQELVTRDSSAMAGFPDCALNDLSHLGLIRVSGADARTFLQGQLTNDSKQVSADTAQLSSYCSPKGRMLGSFWLLQRGDDLYLQLPRERVDAIVKRLRMFVLRAQVTIEDASDALAHFGLSGDCAAELLPFAPAAPMASDTRDGVTILRLPGDRPRFTVIGEPDALGPLWSRCAERASVAGPAFWSLLDIRAGIPSVFDDTVEAFVPQMANLQLIGGISFTKGCYTGQEVVARMQYLGKLKRRMYRAHLDLDTPPSAGAEIHSASSESGQGAGRVVDAAPSPDGGVEALVVMQISSAQADDARLGDAAGPRLTLLPLPYAFETPDG